MKPITPPTHTYMYAQCVCPFIVMRFVVDPFVPLSTLLCESNGYNGRRFSRVRVSPHPFLPLCVFLSSVET